MTRSEAILNVKGMGCPHCSERVEASLVAVPGVAEVVVNLEEGTVSVRGDDLDRDLLAETLRREGYIVPA